MPTYCLHLNVQVLPASCHAATYRRLSKSGFIRLNDGVAKQRLPIVSPITSVAGLVELSEKGRPASLLAIFSCLLRGLPDRFMLGADYAGTEA